MDPNWRSATDADGNVFYFNEKTGELSWSAQDVSAEPVRAVTPDAALTTASSAAKQLEFLALTTTLKIGVLDRESATMITVDDGTAPPRRARFAVSQFALVGCELLAGSSTAEAEVVENELLAAPIDPDILAEAKTVSDALAAVAINASNFACVRLNTVWKMEARDDVRCAVLPVT